MKFLNLKTGYSFDALWSDEQEKGYIFWFENEQSIGLTYTMPIAFITESNSPVELVMEDNDIFSFICPTSITSITEILYLNEYTTIPEKLSDNKYVHIFNIACKSDNAGEYICRINIGDNGYIRIGADFYGEHEPIYINLSNFGIELPTSIQKAIYDTNVHEDFTDHILINRKFKELLSNYWNIIANKGSYESLLNSLKWFEWNEKLNIKEILRYNNGGKTFYLDQNILDEINNNIETYTNNFIKTTYISLYCSLQDELPSYDNEYNPKLQQAAFKWCKEDVQLKIALLAKFFGLYFLPIHLSIFNATAEDKVFTNTIKIIHGNYITREDTIGNFNTITCSIKDNAKFYLTNVKAQVTDDTIFGVKYPNTETFGVDVFPETGKVTGTDDSIKTFSEQYYTGPGAIIPIKLILSNINQNDFIRETIIEYTNDSDEWKQLNFYNKFESIGNNIEIPFNFLAKTAKQYNIHFTFITGSSQTITKKICFYVEDIDNVNINIYKVQAKSKGIYNKYFEGEGFTIDDFNKIDESSKYLFKIQNNSPAHYTQYLPYLNTNTNEYKGIRLNNTITIKVNSEIPVSELSTVIEKYNKYLRKITTIGNYINKNFLWFIKQQNEYITYITFISKYFNDDEVTKYLILATNGINNSNSEDYPYLLKVIKNDLVFYPQFHDLVKIEGNSINDYTIKPYEAICAAAEIVDGDNITKFKYGHLINSTEWSFYNNLTNETIQHPASSQVPFIADTTKLLTNGYYDITFKCSLNDGSIKEYKLDSAFRIKD